MSKIRLTGYLKIPEKNVQSVLEHLSLHLALTRKEPGCLQFNVEQDENEPTKLFVNELFSNQAAFEAHRERTRNSDWYHVTQDAVRHYQVVLES